MAAEQSQVLVSLIGTVLEFAGVLLLALMFLLLRPYARRRLYFTTWSIAWLVLSIALGATVIRFVVQGDHAFASTSEHTGGARLLYGIYQVGVCWFVLLLMAGANQYSHGTSRWRLLRWGLPLVALHAVVSVLRSESAHQVMMAQTPVAVVGFGWCAVRMGGLAPSRQGIGSQLAGSVFAILALVSVLQFLAFWTESAGTQPAPFVLLVRYSAFLDLLLYVFLGFAMVLLLMEQAKREVDDANAELAVAHSAMRRAALYDSLTGCLNRRAFDEGVGLENARGVFGAVMMFDLDELKHVNDTYGHSAGDTLLRHLTDALRVELRPSDKLYRWGGDEFMMLLPGADEARARARLRTVLAEVAVLRLGPNEEEVRLNVSMGSAAYAAAEQIPRAVDEADAMMYREKARKKALRA